MQLVQWDKDAVKALSDAYGAAIFLITQGQKTDAPIVLHVTAQGDAVRLTRAAKALGAHQTKIQRHAPERLATPANLDALVDELLQGGRIVADPTSATGHAAQLADAARRVRSLLPARLRGLYFDPARALVFAWMREPPVAETSRAPVEAAFAEAGADWACVILSRVVPSKGLIPVDQASARALAAERREPGALRRLLLSAAAAVGLTGAVATAAAAQTTTPPATDPLFQAAFKGGGGEINHHGFGSIDGSAGVYGSAFGQLDAKGLFSDDKSDGGVALEFGLRDPSLYRAGVFVADGSAVNNFIMAGAFADLFLDRVNLRVVARDVSVNHGQSKGFFGGRAEFYAEPNTKLFAQADTDGNDTIGSAGVEHAFQSLAGVSVGAEGQFGTDVSGFKVYGKWWFGAPGETLEHHDRFGPTESVLDDLWFAEATKLANKHATYHSSQPA